MARSGTAGTADGLTASRLTPTAIDYARSRGISERTLAQLGAASGTVYFPRRLQSRSEAVVFPYRVDGEVVNFKACAYPDKDFIGKKGGQLQFFNLEAVLNGTRESVFITEGEWDAAALVEAGVPVDCVLSVPNGAREHGESDKPAGYGYVEEALAAGLNRVKRIVWCGDMDNAGRTLRADMAQIFGPARFWFVDWPEGCKDANDYLRTDGTERVLDMVMHGALPWPVTGLYTLDELPEPPAMTLWSPGFPEWEGKIRLAPGTMSVVTGHPGHGKTQLWSQIWFQVARRYDVGIAMASFETRAKPHHRRTLRTLFHGMLERDLTPESRRSADAWINDHYRWILHPDGRPTLDWFLDTAEVAVIRQGVRVIQVDPWNRLESQRNATETETDYIGRCLTALYAFATDMNCHVQVLAHPAKMDSRRKGEPPLLDDISGSKHWDNRVDQGFVVHRPSIVKDGTRQTAAEMYHAKARFEELGHPCKVKLDFDLAAGRYVSTDY